MNVYATGLDIAIVLILFGFGKPKMRQERNSSLRARRLPNNSPLRMRQCGNEVKQGGYNSSKFATRHRDTAGFNYTADGIKISTYHFRRWRFRASEKARDETSLFHFRLSMQLREKVAV